MGIIYCRCAQGKPYKMSQNKVLRTADWESEEEILGNLTDAGLRSEKLSYALDTAPWIVTSERNTWHLNQMLKTAITCWPPTPFTHSALCCNCHHSKPGGCDHKDTLVSIQRSTDARPRSDAGRYISVTSFDSHPYVPGHSRAMQRHLVHSAAGHTEMAVEAMAVSNFASEKL